MEKLLRSVVCCFCHKRVQRVGACTLLIHKGILREWGAKKLLNPRQFLWAHRKCMMEAIPLTHETLE